MEPEKYGLGSVDWVICTTPGCKCRYPRDFILANVLEPAIHGGLLLKKCYRCWGHFEVTFQPFNQKRSYELEPVLA